MRSSQLRINCTGFCRSLLLVLGSQIWEDEPRATCWLWKFGAEACDWDGFEGIETHPGAQMIRDRDQIYSF